MRINFSTTSCYHCGKQFSNKLLYCQHCGGKNILDGRLKFAPVAIVLSVIFALTWQWFIS